MWIVCWDARTCGGWDRSDVKWIVYAPGGTETVCGTTNGADGARTAASLTKFKTRRADTHSTPVSTDCCTRSSILQRTVLREISVHVYPSVQSVSVIVREYVVYVFSKSKNATFYVFLKCHVKKRKNVEGVVQVFTFVCTFKLLTDTFTVKELHTCHVIHTTLY